MSLKEELFDSAPKNAIPEIKKAVDFIEELYSEKELEAGKLEHLLQTSIILSKFNLGEETLIAGLLHDVLTENYSSYEEISERFGSKVAELVKECHEIETVIEGNINRVPVEVLSSIALSIAVDLESMMIRIAAILTVLEHPSPYHDVRMKVLAKTGREVYLPLAMKLGMSGIERRLQDSTFRIENPQAYDKIVKLLGKSDEERKALVEEVKVEIGDLLDGKVETQIYGRPKGYRAIYDKMKRTNFKNIYDLYGIRILCNTDKECYEVLGLIHSKYKLIPGAFDDYISKPKSNGYRSIHTAIIRGKDILEVQIRTWADHLKIESNLYWEYKSLSKNKEFEKHLSWERQLIEWQKSLGKDAKRRAIESKRIFVFTPKKEVIGLAVGSTVIDFAYAVHTDIGHHLKGAKVNGEQVPIETPLTNLDMVEVTTDNKPQVKAGWLPFVKSEKAKAKIRSRLGIKSVGKGKQKSKPASEEQMRKIKMADCCHPLPGEDVIGFKTTKRKIIIHKKDCKNLAKLDKKRLVEIEFERDKGKTELRVTGIDRIGLLGEMLAEIKKSGGNVTSTNFKIKKSGYVEALFQIEIKSVKKFENLMEKLARIPSVHSVERA